MERIFMQTKTSIFSVDFTGTCFKFGCDYILHPIYVDIDTLIKSSITLLNFEKIFNSQATQPHATCHRHLYTYAETAS